MSAQCKNCGHKVNGKYCPNCGQSAHTEDINLHYLAHEIQHSLLHVDKGIIYTARELFTRPGYSIREYIEGKRVNHFKPFAYVFLLSTLFSLLVKLSNQANYLDDFLKGMAAGSSDEGDDVNLATFVSWINWLNEHYALSILILIPIFSLAVYLVFKRHGYNYVQILILNAFVYGQNTIIFFILHVLQFLIQDFDITELMNTAKPIIGFIYSTWVYVQFFKKDAPVFAIFKNILSHVLYTILLIFFLICAMGISSLF
jgi:Protein of unknown function (DUF3667)